MAREQDADPLHSMNTLGAVIMSLDESELKRLINVEKKKGRRDYILRRLHQRYTRVRADRELKELLEHAAG